MAVIECGWISDKRYDCHCGQVPCVGKIEEDTELERLQRRIAVQDAKIAALLQVCAAMMSKLNPEDYQQELDVLRQVNAATQRPDRTAEEG